MRPVVLVAAVLVAAFAAAEAAAYRPLGPRWTTRTIAYRLTAPQYAWSLEQAVAAWNTSGARVRFVRARTPAAAVLMIRTRDMTALGTAGFRTARGRILRAQVSVVPELDRFTAALVLTHELGHVLGLDHDDRRCATMNAYLDEETSLPVSCSVDVPVGKWFCRLLQSDDLRGAIALYGGRARGPRPQPTCFKWAVPPAVETLAAEVPSAGTAALSWTMPASEGVASVEVRRGLDACPDRGTGEALAELSATPGERLAYDDDSLVLEAPGRYCYSLVAVEEAGRAGPAATVWVDHSPEAAPAQG